MMSNSRTINSYKCLSELQKLAPCSTAIQTINVADLGTGTAYFVLASNNQPNETGFVSSLVTYPIFKAVRHLSLEAWTRFMSRFSLWAPFIWKSF